MYFDKFIGIDWSGDKNNFQKGISVAECINGNKVPQIVKPLDHKNSYPGEPPSTKTEAVPDEQLEYSPGVVSNDKDNSSGSETINSITLKHPLSSTTVTT